MSKNELDRKFKRIELVWILNLLPPCSGFGTMYGAGGGAFFLIVLAWIYLYQSKWSLISFLIVYFALSVIGSLAVKNYNLELEKEDQRKEFRNQANVLEEAPLEAYALSSFEAKIKALDNRDSKVEESGTSFVALTEEPDVISNTGTKYKLEEVPKEIVKTENKRELPVDSDLSISDETRSENQLEKLSQEIISIASSLTEISQDERAPESVMRTDSDESRSDLARPAKNKVLETINPQQLKKDTEPEVVSERQNLLEKLGAATGEFQPNAFEAETVNSYDFSSFDDFKFEPETALKSAGENVEGQTECIECGAKRDLNFSFCLACGKNVV